ncbi:MAG: MFS transporter [Acholeplasmataceae bacterium]|nr:MFS transporter [Acholeplasmataceae bacterium]
MHKTVKLIIFYIFIQGVVHNLGHPVTPAFVRSLGISDYMFGIFFAVMSLGLAIGGPLWGILSDQTGRKKRYIMIGLIMYSIGQFGFGYVGQGVWMVFFRLFSGLGVISALTLFMSTLIELSEPKNRGKYFAYLAASSTLGASVGYALGGFLNTNTLMIQWLNTDHFPIIFLIQAMLNTLYVVFIWMTFKDPEGVMVSQEKQSVLKGLKTVIKMDPKLFVFLISLTFITIGSTNLSKYIDVYFDDLGYTTQALGNFVMATGIVSLVASILIVPLFARMRKQLFTIGLLQVLSAFIVFIVFRANQFLLMVYTVYMIYVILKAIYTPLEQNFIAKEAKEGTYGGIMGVRQSFVSIGMVLGPLIGGFIYEVNPLYLFDFSALTFLVGMALLVLVYLMKKKQSASS